MTPRHPHQQPLISTEGVAQESETKSPDDRYHLCRSDASKHTCINYDEVDRENLACYGIDPVENPNEMEILVCSVCKKRNTCKGASP